MWCIGQIDYISVINHSYSSIVEFAVLCETNVIRL